MMRCESLLIIHVMLMVMMMALDMALDAWHDAWLDGKDDGAPVRERALPRAFELIETEKIVLDEFALLGRGFSLESVPGTR